MLKQLHQPMCSPLEIIFNRSLKGGIFPEAMKFADVMPVYKSKERYITNNFRPISVLITISKLLEKIGTLSPANSNQLYQSHYGFRSQHSCENAISELVGEIVKNHEQKVHNRAILNRF